MYRMNAVHLETLLIIGSPNAFSTSFRGDKWAVQIHSDTLESINSEYNLITSSRDSDQSSTETERDQKVTRSLQIVIEESE